MRTCLAASPVPAPGNAGAVSPAGMGEAMPLKARIEGKGLNLTEPNAIVDGSDRMRDVRNETKIANVTGVTLDKEEREMVVEATKKADKVPKNKTKWPTHPTFGQRKIVKTTPQLRVYIEEMALNEGGEGDREGRKAREGGGAGTTEAGGGALPSVDRQGDRKEDVQEGTEQAAMVVIEELELSEEEKKWINFHKVYWKDLSGKIVDQIVSICVACSDPTLFHRAVHDKELCESQSSSPSRRGFVQCSNEHYPLNRCEKIQRDLLAKLNATSREGNVFSHDVHHPWPFRMPHLVKIRNAYVSTTGHIYNDDMVYDPRGGCTRAVDSVIRPELARTRRHFKKVFVADHVFPGIHHELAEMAAQLMSYYPQLMGDKSIMIHTTGEGTPPPGVPKEEGGCWPKQSAIRLIDFLGFNGSRLVAGDVYADEVIVTHMYCWFMDWTFRIYGKRLGRLMTTIAAQAAQRPQNRSGEAETSHGSATSSSYLTTGGGKMEQKPAGPGDNTTANSTNNTAADKKEPPFLLPATSGGSNSSAMKEEVDPLLPPVGQGTILVIKRSGRRRIKNHDELVDALRKALDEGGEEEGTGSDGGHEDHINGTGIIRTDRERRDGGSSLASNVSSASSSPSPYSSFGRRRILEIYDDNLVRDMGEIWRLFMRADIVIAPHGAGLTNALASRDGTAIYEILLPFHLNWEGSSLCLCYRDMCSILGLHYYSDLPTKIELDRFEFDEEQSRWVPQPLAMIIDVPKTIANVRQIFKERGWKFP
ncbi:hypothetical protein CBR_g48267 [Chara braunii]|uniref:Glycosyltransferase n=1 Tax=Chara braunii TaxID=69332 RepID=A0A388M2D4_CHABU|nr:hypothetical protein CBR_g48267 [Chara braunii]|eukprot:GBG88737.1 hypothetical protein CBR_g48267 [Chara braunii]